MAERTHKGPRLRKVPEGDTHERLVCPDCGFVAYENPRVIVGAVATHGERVLLCRRAIEPRRGLWTLPAGFLEMGESPEEGAQREAFEEAGAHIQIDALLAVYTIRHIGQVQLMFRAHLVDPAIEAGPESLEVGLFAWDEIPHDALAFPSVRWALDQFCEVRGQGAFSPRTNPPGGTGRMGASS